MRVCHSLTVLTALSIPAVHSRAVGHPEQNELARHGTNRPRVFRSVKRFFFPKRQDEICVEDVYLSALEAEGSNAELVCSRLLNLAPAVVDVGYTPTVAITDTTTTFVKTAIGKVRITTAVTIIETPASRGKRDLAPTPTDPAELAHVYVRQVIDGNGADVSLNETPVRSIALALSSACSCLSTSPTATTTTSYPVLTEVTAAFGSAREEVTTTSFITWTTLTTVTAVNFTFKSSLSQGIPVSSRLSGETIGPSIVSNESLAFTTPLPGLEPSAASVSMEVSEPAGEDLSPDVSGFTTILGSSSETDARATALIPGLPTAQPYSCPGDDNKVISNIIGTRRFDYVASCNQFVGPIYNTITYAYSDSSKCNVACSKINENFITQDGLLCVASTFETVLNASAPCHLTVVNASSHGLIQTRDNVTQVQIYSLPLVPAPGNAALVLTLIAEYSNPGGVFASPISEVPGNTPPRATASASFDGISSVLSEQVPIITPSPITVVTSTGPGTNGVSAITSYYTWVQGGGMPYSWYASYSASWYAVATVAVGRIIRGPDATLTVGFGGLSSTASTTRARSLSSIASGLTEGASSGAVPTPMTGNSTITSALSRGPSKIADSYSTRDDVGVSRSFAGSSIINSGLSSWVTIGIPPFATAALASANATGGLLSPFSSAISNVTSSTRLSIQSSPTTATQGLAQTTIPTSLNSTASVLSQTMSIISTSTPYSGQGFETLLPVVTPAIAQTTSTVVPEHSFTGSAGAVGLSTLVANASSSGLPASAFAGGSLSSPASRIDPSAATRFTIMSNQILATIESIHAVTSPFSSMSDAIPRANTTLGFLTMSGVFTQRIVSNALETSILPAWAVTVTSSATTHFPSNSSAQTGASLAITRSLCGSGTASGNAAGIINATSVNGGLQNSPNSSQVHLITTVNTSLAVPVSWTEPQVSIYLPFSTLASTGIMTGSLNISSMPFQTQEASVAGASLSASTNRTQSIVTARFPVSYGNTTESSAKPSLPTASPSIAASFGTTFSQPPTATATPIEFSNASMVRLSTGVSTPSANVTRSLAETASPKLLTGPAMIPTHSTFSLSPLSFGASPAANASLIVPFAHMTLSLTGTGISQKSSAPPSPALGSSIGTTNKPTPSANAMTSTIGAASPALATGPDTPIISLNLSNIPFYSEASSVYATPRPLSQNATLPASTTASQPAPGLSGPPVPLSSNTPLSTSEGPTASLDRSLIALSSGGALPVSTSLPNPLTNVTRSFGTTSLTPSGRPDPVLSLPNSPFISLLGGGSPAASTGMPSQSRNTTLSSLGTAYSPVTRTQPVVVYSSSFAEPWTGVATEGITAARTWFSILKISNSSGFTPTAIFQSGSGTSSLSLPLNLHYTLNSSVGAAGTPTVLLGGASVTSTMNTTKSTLMVKTNAVEVASVSATSYNISSMDIARSSSTSTSASISPSINYPVGNGSLLPTRSILPNVNGTSATLLTRTIFVLPPSSTGSPFLITLATYAEFVPVVTTTYTTAAATVSQSICVSPSLPSFSLAPTTVISVPSTASSIPVSGRSFGQTATQDQIDVACANYGNAVLNGDFELGDNITALGWSVSSTNPAIGFIPYVDLDQHRAGSSRQGRVISTQADASITISQPLTLCPNRAYDFEAFGRQARLLDECYVAFYLGNTSLAATRPATSWGAVRETYIAGTTAEEVSVDLDITVACSGTSYGRYGRHLYDLDNVSIVRAE